MRAPLLGLAIGVSLAVGVTRFLGAFLVGISPLDPVTFAGVLGVICVVAFLANYLPARRAASVDPIVSLERD